MRVGMKRAARECIFWLKVFEALSGRFDTQPCDDDNLHGEQTDHHRQHTDDAVLREQ